MLKPNYVGRVKGRPRSGYLAVLLMRDRTRYGRRVHLLVLTAFRGPCPAGMEGCHEDGDTSNNNLFNLRWGTRLSNHADKERHGTKLIGVKNPRAKLDDDRVRTIRARHLLGETKRSLAREYGVSPPVIGDIVSRKKWKHVGD